MPDSIKFNVIERNGNFVDGEEVNFLPENMPFSFLGWVADNVKAAIIEVMDRAGQSRFSKTVGNNGTSGAGDYLSFFNLVSSEDSPWVVTEPSEIINLSVSNKYNAEGATFGVFKNDVEVATIVIPAAHDTYEWKVLSPPVSITSGDLISVKQTTSPNTNDVNMAIEVKVI